MLFRDAIKDNKCIFAERIMLFKRVVTDSILFNHCISSLYLILSVIDGFVGNASMFIHYEYEENGNVFNSYFINTFLSGYSVYQTKYTPKSKL